MFSSTAGPSHAHPHLGCLGLAKPGVVPLHLRVNPLVSLRQPPVQRVRRPARLRDDVHLRERYAKHVEHLAPEEAHGRWARGGGCVACEGDAGLDGGADSQGVYGGGREGGAVAEGAGGVSYEDLPQLRGGNGERVNDFGGRARDEQGHRSRL